MGLRGKLTFYVVGIFALIQVVWGVSLVHNETAMLRNEAQLRGQEVLRALAAPCAVALANGEFTRLDAIVAQFAVEGSDDLNLRSVAVLDETGFVVAHTNPREYGLTWEDDRTLRALSSPTLLVEEVESDDGRFLYVALPLVSGIRWGTAVTEISLDGVERRISLLTRQIFSVSLIAFLVIAAVLRYLLERLVILPVDQLSRTARQISAGSLDARVPLVRRDDELALLGRVFNEMAEEMETYTTDLEAIVADRTRELQASHDALEAANDELGEAVVRLRKMARTDGLTGLLNHRAFFEALEIGLQQADRGDRPLCLLMVDVDHFKRFNDTHGHPAGDRVLAEVANLLQQNLRGTDVIGRYGGEEFAILLVDAGRDAAIRVAEKLRNAIRDKDFETATGVEQITISIGIGAFPEDARLPGDLVVRADDALYRAKSLGRDRVVA